MGGGNPISAITDPISDVLGTSGGGGGILGAVEDVGQVIGDAGEIIDKNVIQPAVQDPVGTAVKIGAIAAAPATGGASLYAIPAYTATKAIAAGVPIEDVAKMTAISAAATAAGVSVADYVGTLAEFGTEIGSQQTAMLAAQNAGIGTMGAASTAAGQIAGGAIGGAVGQGLAGGNVGQGLLSGATNAALGAGVNNLVDAGAGLFNQTNTGSTGMDGLFNTTGEDFNMGGIFSGTGEDFNMGGGLYGQFDINTRTGEDFNLSGNPEFNAYSASLPGFADYAKKFGLEAAKALFGIKTGGTAGQGGAAGGARRPSPGGEGVGATGPGALPTGRCRRRPGGLDARGA